MAAAEAAQGEKSGEAAVPTPAPAPIVPTEAIVHPIVLLGVVDHYNRVARDTDKRVVGVLLGETDKDGKIDVTTSFAVPFEEDARDASIWYLDHNFLEAMADMFRKVNSREKIIGFYSTGPKIRPADIELDALFQKYTPHPCFVIVDIRPDVEGIPTTAYVSTQEVVDGKDSGRAFRHVASSVGAHEPEEMGVEHLLRDVNDPSVSELAEEVRHKLLGLKGLAGRLGEMSKYLQAVLAGDLPVNHDIMYRLQGILNLLPNLGVDKLVTAFARVGNDLHLAMYVGNLVRSITALHDLVSNKLQYRDVEDSVFSAGAAKPTAAAATEEAKTESGSPEKK